MEDDDDDDDDESTTNLVSGFISGLESSPSNSKLIEERASWRMSSLAVVVEAVDDSAFNSCDVMDRVVAVVVDDVVDGCC